MQTKNMKNLLIIIVCVVAILTTIIVKVIKKEELKPETTTEFERNEYLDETTLKNADTTYYATDAVDLTSSKVIIEDLESALKELPDWVENSLPSLVESYFTNEKPIEKSFVAKVMTDSFDRKEQENQVTFCLFIEDDFLGKKQLFVMVDLEKETMSFQEE